MKRLLVTCGYRDRPTELYGLLCSLRTQTFKDFDIAILNDQSGTSWQNYYFLVYIINRLKIEGHNVEVENTPFPFGVSRMRQHLADKSLKLGYELSARIDDDSVLDQDYLEKLIRVIDSGYDIATGIVPHLNQPSIKREVRFMHGSANYVIFDAQGNHIINNDDCGIPYLESVIIPADHFRSCAIMKTKVFEKVKYFPTRLSMHGFREEQLFSYKAIIEGFKIGCHTGAVAWHLACPSGGERFQNQNELISLNQQVFEEDTRELFKQHGDFIGEYHLKLNVPIWQPQNEEIMKENNLSRR